MTINKPILLSALIALSIVSPARALEGDTFRPFVSFSRYYDDNLFRLAENETIFIDGGVKRGPQADSYNVLAFGANVDWRLSRQQILGRATKSLVRYTNFNSLDYDGSDYLAQWNWQLGNYWNGQIGATKTLSQSSFTDLNTNIAVNNQRTIDNAFATANWLFHPRWQIGSGISQVKVLNSDPNQAFNDFTEQSEEVNLTWRTPKGTSLRAQLRLAQADYPNRQASTIDNSYTQQELNISTTWPYSGLLRLQGRIGYVEREHKTISERDFSGLTGRATADYFPSGKTALSFSLYRELAAVSEISSSYRLATGISLNAAWSPTAKITLRGGVSDETAKFQGDPGFYLFDLPVREDRTQNASLSLNYEPMRSTVIGLGVQTGRRESNNVFTVNDYKFNTMFANVRVDF